MKKYGKYLTLLLPFLFPYAFLGLGLLGTVPQGVVALGVSFCGWGLPTLYLFWYTKGKPYSPWLLFAAVALSILPIAIAAAQNLFQPMSGFLLGAAGFCYTLPFSLITLGLAIGYAARGRHGVRKDDVI